MKKYIIAIDGPGASGKSTTAKILAKKMAYIYIDTGAMYRACALSTLTENINLKDNEKLAKMLEKIKVEIEYSQNGNQLFLNDINVTKRVREADITKLASEIATIGIVRTKMVDLQRKIGENGGVIMDGRDIGTVVFPNADFKFFMVADVKTRAMRRWKEAKKKGEILNLDEVEKELIWRDNNDSKREISPLKRATDAIPIDNSNLTIEEQVQFILQKIKQKKDKK